MKRFFSVLFFLVFFQIINAQISTVYIISFENAVHHEATVNATFTNLESDEIDNDKSD